MQLQVRRDDSSGEFGVSSGASPCTPDLRRNVVELLAVLPAISGQLLSSQTIHLKRHHPPYPLLLALKWLVCLLRWLRLRRRCILQWLYRYLLLSVEVRLEHGVQHCGCSLRSRTQASWGLKRCRDPAPRLCLMGVKGGLDRESLMTTKVNGSL